MSVPINLPIGYVLVYGMGTGVSSSGIQLPTEQSPLRFGTIYQIWDGGAPFIYGNDNVMFDNNDGVRLVFSNIPYTMIPARLVTKEEPLL